MNSHGMNRSVISLWVLMLSALALSIESVASEQQPAKALSFAVYLDGREIGTHHYRFTPAGNGFELESVASYDVRFLFINAYSYRHRSEESWRDGCITAISSTTDANGELYKVEGQQLDGSMSLLQTGNDVTPVTVDCLRSYAYWDRELLAGGKLLNSQTGAIEHVELQAQGPAPLPWDQSARAASYELRHAYKDERIRLWYGPDGRWLGLQSVLDNGRTLHYQRLNDVNPAIHPGSGATP